MSPAPDEAERQRQLDTYRIVDSLPEAAYDDIVRLAAALCGAPVALISLIDRDRQWFRARSGFEPRETPRDIAFCDHAIRDPEHLLEVPDARDDARFAANPLVTGPEQVRFYAGMPLVTPAGAAIGTVCVLDREPRTLNEGQRAALSSLARLAMNLFESRHRTRELELALQLAARQPATGPDAAPAAAAAATASPCTVALFQVQDIDLLVARVGERGAERVLGELDRALDACLPPGDHVCRTTGSAECVAVLRGAQRDRVLTALLAAAERFARSSGLQVLDAASESEQPGERIEAVFLRADLALSRRKDAARAAA